MAGGDVSVLAKRSTSEAKYLQRPPHSSYMNRVKEVAENGRFKLSEVLH